jgi:hypothetical protein
MRNPFLESAAGDDDTRRAALPLPRHALAPIGWRNPS